MIFNAVIYTKIKAKQILRNLKISVSEKKDTLCKMSFINKI